MQEPISPWRRMRDAREIDRRVDHAQWVTFLPFVTMCIGVAAGLLALASGHGSLPLHALVSSWRIAMGVVLSCLYAFAAWRIGKREAIGGILALLLFAWSIGNAAWHGRVLSLATAYAILGIVLVLRVAEELHLKPGSTKS